MQTKWLTWSTEHEWNFQHCPEWKEAMLMFSPRLMKFWMNAMTETLPSPDNLKRWGVKKQFSCGLCKKKNVTSLHVLAGCIYVLGKENRNPHLEDRYTWRHNKFFKVFKKELEALILKMNSLEVVKKKDEAIV